MLNGMLGRGFASKCKSLIKLTKTRIDTIRRKRNATQMFLKHDVADLLANGHDVNALRKAEGLLLDLAISSSYDFIEQCCECILLHLLDMQKQSECHEECRVAVSSLTFAAARFSDLPELRDLRDIFQEKYGSSLECYADRKFVENLASRSPTLDQKIKLTQDIALEFSIKWDGVAFGKKMLKPPVPSSNRPKTYGPSNLDNESKTPNAPNAEAKKHKHDNGNGNSKFSPRVQEEGAEKTKAPCNLTIPPPYHKSSNPKTRVGDLDRNRALMDPLIHNTDGNRSAGVNDHGKHPPQHHHAEDAKSKQRSSSRRRHHNTSEKRNASTKGLRILLDDAADQKDEDEQMLDQLLIHYCHKPSSYDAEKARRRMKADMGITRGESPAMVPPPSRSISLPREQAAQSEAPKVFSRVTSLQPARHLHPKLPDYDDLVAKFAAMKAEL